MKQFSLLFFALCPLFTLLAFGPGGGIPGGNPGGGGWQPGGGGNQPDQPGGGGMGGSFTYDTFLTDPTVSGGCIVYDNLMTGYVAGMAEIVLPSTVTEIADGALAGNADVTSIDATAATGLTAVPESFAVGCGNLVEIALPSNVAEIGPSAFAMDAALEKVYAEGVTETGEYAFFGCPRVEMSVSSLFVVEFDANGGACGTSSVKVEAGGTIGDLPTATRTGFDFVGWFTSESGGTRIDELTIVSASMTVYARWERLETPELAAGEASQIPAFGTSVGGTVTWSAKGLPTGMKIAARDLTDKTLGGIAAGTIYGTPTKPGTYVVTLTAKGSTTETFTEEIVIGNYADELIPVQDRYGTYRVGVRTALDLSDFADCKVSGLPTGLKFATKAVTDATFGSVEAGWVFGVPTRACTNTVTFTKTVSELVDGKSRRVTHKASATFVVVGHSPCAVGTWNGVAAPVGADESVAPVGSFTLTATATGALSAKAVTSDGTATFSTKGWTENEGGILTATMTNKTSEVLSVRLDPSVEWTADSLTASLSGGRFADENMEISAYRNPYGKTGKTVENADAQGALLAAVGTWTVVVNGPDGESLSGTAKIQKTGVVKVTGKLSDGKTSYSMNGILEVRDADGALVPSLRLVGVSKYGCVRCEDVVSK